MFDKAAGDDAEHKDRDKDVHQLKAVVGIPGEFGSDRREGTETVTGSIETEFRRWESKKFFMESWNRSR